MKTIRLTSGLRVAGMLFVLLASAMLQGCGGGGSSTPPPTPTADPTGYYDVTGTASVGDGSGGTLTITDLQGMVTGNHFTALSVATGLAYDGTITKITGTSFTATVSIYKDGVLLSTAPLNGTITQGSSIAGDLTGTAQGKGNINLTYAMANNQVAAISRVQNNNSEAWYGQVGGSVNAGSATSFIVDNLGAITNFFAATDGAFNGCVISSGSIQPVSNQNIYTIQLVLDSCKTAAVNGDYSGISSTKSVSSTDDTLIVVVSNPGFSIAGEFTRGSTL